jgi:preprotein translocase subunit SecF
VEFFKIRRDIPFMRHALVFNIISFLTFAAAVFFLFTRGLHLSVEFTGGTVMEVAYTQPANVEQIRQTVAGAELRHRARRHDSPARSKGRELGAAK